MSQETTIAGSGVMSVAASRMGRTLLLVGLCLAASVGQGWSQTTTGIISGTVMDSTNAVIPGATVTLTNLGTGFTVTETTGSAGTYRKTNLPLGMYEVKVELSGFRTSTRRGIELGRAAAIW